MTLAMSLDTKYKNIFQTVAAFDFHKLYMTSKLFLNHFANQKEIYLFHLRPIKFGQFGRLLMCCKYVTRYIYNQVENCALRLCVQTYLKSTLDFARYVMTCVLTFMWLTQIIMKFDTSYHTHTCFTNQYLLGCISTKLTRDDQIFDISNDNIFRLLNLSEC